MHSTYSTIEIGQYPTKYGTRHPILKQFKNDICEMDGFLFSLHAQFIHISSPTRTFYIENNKYRLTISTVVSQRKPKAALFSVLKFNVSLEILEINLRL